MPYKQDESGNIVSRDGMPVFVAEDGSETLVNFESLRTELNSTRSEAKAKKEKLREFESKIKEYQSSYGDIDPEKARKALEIMSNLDQKKLIAAGEMDAAIKQAVESVESKYKPQIDGFSKKLKEYEEGISYRDSIINQHLIGSALNNSAFLNKNTRTTPDVRQAILGKNFKVEKLENGDMRTVAVDEEGNKIYSPNDPGRLANPEEAIQILWNRYIYKDNYSLSGGSGSGSTGNPGGGGTLKSVYTRDEWNALFSKASKPEKAALAQKIMKNEITVR